MEILNIPRMAEDPTVSAVSDRLDLQKRHALGHAPWPDFPFKPQAAFSIGHSGNRILLKFYVTEPNVMARQVQTNGPVHLDSCVELFIAWGDEPAYYNLEFGCSGTCHFGYGPSRNRRSPIDRELVEKVVFESRFRTSRVRGQQVAWELTLVIPIEVFSFHELGSLDDQHCRVNFYKCGEDLPEPHYLAWGDIRSEKPDFHLPEFFRKAHFNVRKPIETYIPQNSP